MVVQPGLCQTWSVTAQLISAFVLATLVVQLLLSESESILLWLYSLDCVRPGQ